MVVSQYLENHTLNPRISYPNLVSVVSLVLYLKRGQTFRNHSSVDSVLCRTTCQEKQLLIDPCLLFTRSLQSHPTFSIENLYLMITINIWLARYPPTLLTVNCVHLDPLIQEQQMCTHAHEFWKGCLCAYVCPGWNLWITHTYRTDFTHHLSYSNHYSIELPSNSGHLLVARL
jgi:hypothetical protein